MPNLNLDFPFKHQGSMCFFFFLPR